MNPSPAISNHARPCEYRVPDHVQLSECRSCHAPIIWATTRSGKAIPLSVSTIRTDEQGQRWALTHSVSTIRTDEQEGQRWALTHFADCPSAAQHRNPVPPSADAVQINLMDLPAYMADHRLVVTHSTITDNGNGILIVELFTRKIA